MGDVIRVYLGKVQKEIIKLLGEYKRLHTNKMARMLNKQYIVVLNALRGLEEKGFVSSVLVEEKYPTGIGFLRVRYWELTPEGRRLYKCLVRNSRISP